MLITEDNNTNYTEDNRYQSKKEDNVEIFFAP
jgi:hypothetical protein